MDVILAHPDHPIPLDGTTTMDGDQAARVELSNSRAVAMKQLLIDKFGVPEGQLQIIGLVTIEDKQTSSVVLTSGQAMIYEENPEAGTAQGMEIRAGERVRITSDGTGRKPFQRKICRLS